MITKIELEDGKYTVVMEIPDESDPTLPFAFYALRFGDRWREMAGDKMIGAMFNRIIELEEIINSTKNK